MKRNIKSVLLTAVKMVVLAVGVCFLTNCEVCGVRTAASAQDWIVVYRFNDTTLKHNIRVSDPTDYYITGDYAKYFYKGGNYVIYKGYEIDPTSPLFVCHLDGNQSELNGYFNYGGTYDICDLAENDVYLELHDGWCLCYRYPYIQHNEIYLNADWSEICDLDWDKVQQRPADYVEKKVEYCWFFEQTLSHLCKKETAHFGRSYIDELTMDDVVETLNKLIDEGKIYEECDTYNTHAQMAP